MGWIMTIFLDMDGVVSDLAQGMCKLFDMPYEEFLQKQPKTWGIAPVFGVSYEEMWSKIIPDQPDSFYAELPEYPWAKTLYEECCKRARTVFLTAPVNSG